MPTKDKGYKNLRERAAGGDYELVEPLDYVILDKLPLEGEMFAGLYPLAATSSDLKTKFPQEVRGMIVGRVSSLHIQGLALKVKALKGGGMRHAWQRSKKGDQLLKEWKAANGS